MKIGLLTFYLPNYESVAQLTQPGKEEYAIRHGYTSFVQREIYDPIYDMSFQRVKLIRDYLATHSDIDWLWVHGIDTVVMNHGVKLEWYIERYPGKEFLICKDVNGINDDSFLIRNSTWSQKWLNFLLSKHDEYKNDCWSSQRTIQHNEYHPDFKDGIQIVPHEGPYSGLQDYFYDLYRLGPETPGNYKPGAFCLHLPGLSLQERLDILRSSRVQDSIIK